MEKRFLLFVFLASAILLANAYILHLVSPPAQPEVAQERARPVRPAEDERPAGEEPPAAEPQPPPAEPVDPEQPEEEIAPRWLTLGSVDPASNYRMLVTLTNMGAAVERIELASANLRDLEDDAGYLGHLAPVAAPEVDGVLVRVVGPGTPAAAAGVQVGDIITEIDDEQVRGLVDFEKVMQQTEPGQTVKLTVQRDGKARVLTARLARPPLKVVQTEAEDPLSLLMTLERLGGQTIPRGLGLDVGEPADGGEGVEVTRITPDSPAARSALREGDVISAIDAREIEDAADWSEAVENLPAGSRVLLKIRRLGQEIKLPLALEAEIPGLDLRKGTWEVESADGSQVTFRRRLPRSNLELIKQYRLARVQPEDEGANYHLVLRVAIRNRGQEERTVAYQLDGPTGLPTEGWWYASKVSPNWGSAGVRDIVVRFEGNAQALVHAVDLIGDDDIPRWKEETPLDYIGVDAQYLAAVLIPQRDEEDRTWFAEVLPMRVGHLPEDKYRHRLVNTSFRLISRPYPIAPGGAVEHEYVVFAGPKKPDLLAEYGLDDLVYYGWPIWGFFARPLSWVLHFFESLVGNYGLAIIMLTILVRGCMFPLSRKQALSAQKMQELQPELKRLGEKYKNDPLALRRAQGELFRKHNFRPLGGCLLMFIQLPIFIGLYRALMVDVELRQAPLIPGLDWASNLAAPDMLFRWESWMPAFLADETGYLGPYFNLLPVVTIALFIWQQKMFMPPPADEQAALQQKMMKYMMVFMGFLFFKVASGLCIYFIASSLWGIAERKLLPKTKQAGQSDKQPPAAEPRSKLPPARGNGDGAAAARKQRRKQRGGK